jgi:hypothetical protein
MKIINTISIVIALTLGMISTFLTLTGIANACPSSGYQIACSNTGYEMGQRFANSDLSHDWYMPSNQLYINEVCMNKLFTHDPTCAFVEAFNSGYNHVFGTDLAATSTSLSQDSINK